jgi:SAM-dependent methyltransferase
MSRVCSLMHSIVVRASSATSPNKDHLYKSQLSTVSAPSSHRKLADAIRSTEQLVTVLQVGSLNSITRDRWVQQRLEALPSSWVLLDAGAGEQRYRASCSHLVYVSQDNEAYDGRGDGLGGHIPSWTYGPSDIVCDICSIPRPDNSFDAILCTEVLEHVPDPVAALTELARLVRPGGRMILSAPFVSFTHFAPYHYCTGFSRYWYEHHLRSLGFDVCEAVPNGNFFEFLAQELRRLPQMVSDYTGRKFPRLGSLCISILLAFLQKFSSADTGSANYASFGWHIVAVKTPSINARQ